MLSMKRLHTVARELETTPALTVYGSSRYEDPKARREWRVVLDAELQRIGDGLAGASHQERTDYARAVERVNEVLAEGRIPVSADGWIIVATADRVVLADPVTASEPVVAFWRRGIEVAPFVRTFAGRGAALVALADGRSVRLYRYEDEALRALETLNALSIRRSAYHMSAPPRRGFHSGTRGTTGRDAAERDRRAARSRMVRQAAARLTLLRSAKELVLLGGIPQVATSIQDALPGELVVRSRLIELDVHAGEGDIRRAARTAVTEAREEEERAFVEDIVARHAEGPRAVLGVRDVMRRLAEGSVARLVVSDRFLRSLPDEADRVVRTALAQGAALGFATAGAAERLDEQGEGIGGTLRFAPGEPLAPGSVAEARATV